MMCVYRYRGEKMSEVDNAYQYMVSAIFIQGAKDLTYLYRKAGRIAKKKGPAWDIELEQVKRSIRFLEQWFREVLPEWLDIDPDTVIDQCRVNAAKARANKNPKGEKDNGEK